MGRSQVIHNPMRRKYPSGTNRLRISAITAGLLAAGILTDVNAQVQTAGALLVDVDATSQALRPLNSIPNRGTLQGVFSATGGAAAVPVVAQVGGTKAIQLDGGDYLQLTDPN